MIGNIGKRVFSLFPKFLKFDLDLLILRKFFVVGLLHKPNLAGKLDQLLLDPFFAVSLLLICPSEHLVLLGHAAKFRS